jgi:hypothetical protein
MTISNTDGKSEYGLGIDMPKMSRIRSNRRNDKEDCRIVRVPYH